MHLGGKHSAGRRIPLILALAVSFAGSLAFATAPVTTRPDAAADLLQVIEIDKRIEGMTKQSLLYFKNNENRMANADERRANTRAWLRYQESQARSNAEVKSELLALVKRKFTAEEIVWLNSFYRARPAVRFKEFMNSPEANAVFAKPYDRAKQLLKEESARHP